MSNIYELSELSERFRQLRKEKKYNQLDLARKLFVSKTTVSNWETGKTLPSHRELLEMRKLYGVSVDYILGFTDYRKPENDDDGSSIGLTEKAVELLRGIKEHPDKWSDTCQFAGGHMVDIINKILEETFDRIQDADCHSVRNLFTVMAQALLAENTKYTALMKPEDNEDEFMKKGVLDRRQLLTIENEDETLITTVNEIEQVRQLYKLISMIQRKELTEKI